MNCHHFRAIQKSIPDAQELIRIHCPPPLDKGLKRFEKLCKQDTLAFMFNTQGLKNVLNIFWLNYRPGHSIWIKLQLASCSFIQMGLVCTSPYILLPPPISSSYSSPLVWFGMGGGQWVLTFEIEIDILRWTFDLYIDVKKLWGGVGGGVLRL